MAGWRDLPRPGARPPPSRRAVRFSVHTLTGEQLGRPGRPPLEVDASRAARHDVAGRVRPGLTRRPGRRVRNPLGAVSRQGREHADPFTPWASPRTHTQQLSH